MKLHVTGDIGCYTLGALAPLSAIDTVLCMGRVVGMAQGFPAPGATNLPAKPWRSLATAPSFIRA
jgi:TPP-dependent indolepyruvate ferredoxin oxidoreductase alpha subunit